MGPYVLAALFLLSGAFVAFQGYGNIASVRKKRREWVTCDATVIALSKQGYARSRGRDTYLLAPIYQYVYESQMHTVTGRIASYPASYKVGDPIRVLVNPARPGQSEVLNGGVGLFTYGTLALGAFVFAIGVLLVWLAATGSMTFD